MTGFGEGSQNVFTVYGKTDDAIKNSGLMRLIISYGPNALKDLNDLLKYYEKQNNFERLKILQEIIYKIEMDEKRKENVRKKWKVLAEKHLIEPSY